MATFAFRSGLSSDLIQLMGDWRSDAYKEYLQYSFEDKITVSKLISKNLEKE